MIHDRNIHNSAAVAHELVVMPINLDAQITLTASTTKHASVVVPFKCFLVKVGLLLSAKANTDNTVTLTFLKNGSAFSPAVTNAIVSGSGTGEQKKETAVGDAALAAGDIVSVDTGALGGTAPVLSKPVFYLVVRKGGADAQPGFSAV